MIKETCERCDRAMKALGNSIVFNRQLLDERNRYKAALEKMIIPGAGVPCRCGVCYVCIASEALRVSEIPKETFPNVARDWNCKVCGVLKASDASRRCVNGHDT